MNKFKLLLIALGITITSYGQSVKKIKTDVFSVTYSEIYQQPLEVSYQVKCIDGDADRSGMSFKKYPGVITSDDKDYIDNVWDKGHMAPAADFNCTEELLEGTFSYLNCALQHQGLNRGPWKELERFERDLAKVYAFVSVTIVIKFDPQNDKHWLKTGALVPIGFTKTIWCDGERFEFYFPNADVAGRDWSEFKIN